MDAYITILIRNENRVRFVENWRFNVEKLSTSDFTTRLSLDVTYEVEHIPYNELLVNNCALLTRDKGWFWEVTYPCFNRNIFGQGYRC